MVIEIKSFFENIRLHIWVTFIRVWPRRVFFLLRILSKHSLCYNLLVYICPPLFSFLSLPGVVPSGAACHKPPSFLYFGSTLGFLCQLCYAGLHLPRFSRPCPPIVFLAGNHTSWYVQKCQYLASIFRSLSFSAVIAVSSAHIILLILLLKALYSYILFIIIIIGTFIWRIL